MQCASTRPVASRGIYAALLDTAIPFDPWFVEAAARAMPLPFLLPEARGVAATWRLIEELDSRLELGQPEGESARM